MNDRNDTYIWNETEKNAAKTAAPRRNKKTVSLGRRLTALVLSAALFGAVSAGTFYGVGRLLPQEESTSARAEDPNAVITSLASTSYSTTRYGMDVSDIAAAALPSVVAITNISVQEVRSYFNRFGPNGAGQTQLEETTSCGSGVIIANDGTYLYMVTNAHVVENATALSVSFVDNSVYEAQLCGADEETDLAVIKVALSDLSADTLSQIAVIAVGDSDELEVGEQRRRAAESGRGAHRHQHRKALRYGCRGHGLCHPHLRCGGDDRPAYDPDDRTGPDQLRYHPAVGMADFGLGRLPACCMTGEERRLPAAS